MRNNFNAAVEEKMALLERIAVIAEKQAALAGGLSDPANNDEFDRLALERKVCAELIDVIDSTNLTGATYETKEAANMAKLMQSIKALDRQIIEQLTQESALIKRQLNEQFNRKKSMVLYNTNILARKSMILDESK